MLFFPPTFSSSSSSFFKLFPNYLQEKIKKKKTAALPASQFFCSKDKRSFRIRGEGGKAKKKKKGFQLKIFIRVKNLTEKLCLKGM